MSTDIGGFKLKPFACPNCKHDIFVGLIKIAEDDDGLHGEPIGWDYPSYDDDPGDPYDYDDGRD